MNVKHVNLSFYSFRVLEAGKATIYSTLNVPRDITHLLTNTALNQEREKHLFGAPCYPVYYLGFYLLEASKLMRPLTEIHASNTAVKIRADLGRWIPT